MLGNLFRLPHDYFQMFLFVLLIPVKWQRIPGNLFFLEYMTNVRAMFKY